MRWVSCRRCIRVQPKRTGARRVRVDLEALRKEIRLSKAATDSGVASPVEKVSVSVIVPTNVPITCSLSLTEFPLIVIPSPSRSSIRSDNRVLVVRATVTLPPLRSPESKSMTVASADVSGSFHRCDARLWRHDDLLITRGRRRKP